MSARRRHPADGGPRVIVVGAGFAGLAAVKALDRAGAQVMLVDRNIYSTFQPLLYQVATGAAPRAWSGAGVAATEVPGQRLTTASSGRAHGGGAVPAGWGPTLPQTASSTASWPGGALPPMPDRSTK